MNNSTSRSWDKVFSLYTNVHDPSAITSFVETVTRRDDRVRSLLADIVDHLRACLDDPDFALSLARPVSTRKVPPLYVRIETDVDGEKVQRAIDSMDTSWWDSYRKDIREMVAVDIDIR